MEAVINPECLSSVAPQQLEVGTVQINPIYDTRLGKKPYASHCTRPHLLVWSNANGQNPQVTSMYATGIGNGPQYIPDEPAFAGVALEPIHDGTMAATNPTSAGRIAIAVGGIVSIAVPSNPPGEANLNIGQKVWLDYRLAKLAEPSCPPNNPHLGFQVGMLTATEQTPALAVGVIVDNTTQPDGYVRVRLH